MKRIIIGIDGSPGAAGAVREGIELASEAGANVTFVCARRTISLLGAPYYQRRLTRQLSTARAAVEQAMTAAELAGVRADYEIVEGDPVDELLNVAGHRDADLIVVGSRGLGAISGAVLGSVSKALVEMSPIPVLVAKSDEHAAEPEPEPEPAASC